MRKSKKAWIILIVSVLLVLVVGTIATTYAWFLSRYTREFEFTLNAGSSSVIIRYETALRFASGDEATSGNALVPATANRTVGISQAALSPLDVFNDDGAVQTAAHPVKFTAEGAYWTGAAEEVGKFSFSLNAYLHGEAQTEANDLVGTSRGEIGYYLVLFYQGQRFLFYDGTYYIHNTTQSGAVHTFDHLTDGTYYWHALQTTDQVDNKDILEIKDGKQYLLLQPNSIFSYVLYVFVAKTDEELDPIINGAQITLAANLKIEESAESQGGNE